MEKSVDTSVNLWVDDIRVPPAGWAWAKDYDQAIIYMQENPVEAISLDHDLADIHYAEAALHQEMSPGTGYDVLKWMSDNAIWPGVLCLHTANPVGRQNMRNLINNSGLYNPMVVGTIMQYEGIDIFFKKDLEFDGSGSN